MTAYYNEIDPYAAQWLRNLIKVGHIAPGDVDERSIEDVHPADLRNYTQCHFFAGVGVWSYALRNAGWPDDRPIWTGSCPCQPFSAAGKGAGFDDERHLWPAFYHLIKECKPASVIGEQVASKDSGPWIDLVHTDMEALGYAFGAIPFPSAGVGAPHIRDRLYWVAHANNTGLEGRRAMRQRAVEQFARTGGVVGGVDDAHLQHKSAAGDASRTSISGRSSPLSGMGNTNSKPAKRNARGACGTQDEVYEPDPRDDNGSGHAGKSSDNCGPTNGFWADADWLGCRDGKWRPVESGTFPLVNGTPSRVGRLRAFGNAINAEAAKVFIESFIEATA